MAIAPLRLPRLPKDVQFTDPKSGMPTKRGQQWWQRAMEQIEAGVNAVIDAQNAADAAQAAADAAQDAADAAQAAVDAIVVPPSGTISVSSNTVLNGTASAVLVDATSGAIAITLPSALSSIPQIAITKTDASGNAVNVSPAGGDTINGGAGPVALVTQNEVRTFVTDQVSQWFG